MSTLDVNKVLDRAKDALNVSSDAKLAERLGYGASAVANWRQRGSINVEAITQAVHESGSSTDWVLYGVKTDAGVKQAHLRDVDGSVMMTVNLKPGQSIDYT